MNFDTTIRALKLADELQERVEQVEDLDTVPMTAVVATEGTLTISIGPFVVWDSEEHDNEEDLTVAACLERFASEIRNYHLIAVADHDHAEANGS